MTALHDQFLKEPNELTNFKKKTLPFHTDYSLNLHNINEVLLHTAVAVLLP